ncbi:MAG: STAS domain-containing protein [Pseudobdellovibrionaceae bacterium]|nr:STAS domain-containing protein [Bdellovibrionales bacterium]USN48235.1 MAG: STAS domain-containing protein [Pseudobdellovibrionaceae bacterium]
MDAKIEEFGDIIVVRLGGFMDFESADAFRANCVRHFSGKKVIFNLTGLSFIGSSGITPFVEGLADLTKNNKEGLRFCGVGAEFRRVFRANSVIRQMEFFENEYVAHLSLQRPPQPPVAVATELPKHSFESSSGVVEPAPAFPVVNGQSSTEK